MVDMFEMWDDEAKFVIAIGRWTIDGYDMYRHCKFFRLVAIPWVPLSLDIVFHGTSRTHMMKSRLRWH